MWTTQTVKTRTNGASSLTTVLAANPDRIGLVIQNLGTNVMYISLSSTCSTSAYDQILKAGTAAADGTGGVFEIKAGVIYTGQVTSAGTAVSYTAFEF